MTGEPRLPVPYVIEWTDENAPPTKVIVTAQGVAYADEESDAYRDLDGVLWERRVGSRTGHPEYAAELHPLRQRTAMDGFLCAVDGCPADRDPDLGMLWLMPREDAAGTALGHWEGMQTAIPPLCLPHAVMASRFCPRLREGYVALRVKEAELIGVRGTLYPPLLTEDPVGEIAGPSTLPAENVLVRCDSPDIAFVVAKQLVRELRNCTPVSLFAPDGESR